MDLEEKAVVPLPNRNEVPPDKEGQNQIDNTRQSMSRGELEKVSKSKGERVYFHPPSLQMLGKTLHKSNKENII